MNKNIYVLFIDTFWVCSYLHATTSVTPFVRLLNFTTDNLFSICCNFASLWRKNKKVIDDRLPKGVVPYAFGETVRLSMGNRLKFVHQMRGRIAAQIWIWWNQRSAREQMVKSVTKNADSISYCLPVLQ